MVALLVVTNVTGRGGAFLSTLLVLYHHKVSILFYLDITDIYLDIYLHRAIFCSALFEICWTMNDTLTNCNHKPLPLLSHFVKEQQ